MSAELNQAAHLALHSQTLTGNPAFQEVVARLQASITEKLFSTTLDQQEDRENLYRKQISLREVLNELEGLLGEYEQMKVTDNG